MTYKLPAELVEELDAATRRCEMPRGLTVAVALEMALALDDDELTALVDAAAERMARARRLARRAQA